MICPKCDKPGWNCPWWHWCRRAVAIAIIAVAWSIPLLIGDPARAGGNKTPKEPSGLTWVVEHKFERCYFWQATEGRFVAGSGTVFCVPLSALELTRRCNGLQTCEEGVPLRTWILFNNGD